MMKRIFLFGLIACAAVVSGCNNEHSVGPTSPSPQTLAQTPSMSADVISIHAVRDGSANDGSPLMTVTIGENLNKGQSGPDADWNGATIELIRNCSGKESKVVLEYPNDKDPSSGKNIVVFKREVPCVGQINFRLRGTPRGGTMRDFNFPNGERQASLMPDTVKFVRDSATGFVYVRGALP